MPGPLVHTNAVIQCFHGAPVQVPPPAPPRVFVNLTQAVLSLSQMHTVVGCPFQITVGLVTKLQPCVKVLIEPATRVFINGTPALILTPAAICQSVEQIPQGVPNASPTQLRVIAT
jgi:hypothetical protein